MNEWKEIELGDYVKKIGSGVTPTGGSSIYKTQGIALIRSQNIYNSKFQYEGLAYIDDDIANSMSGVEIFKDDILLNITGDSVARCCIVPLNILPARVNQHVSIIRPTDKINNHFLMYYLISPEMQLYLLSISGSGGTRKALTKMLIENLKIKIPPLPIQKCIASILSAYDDLIDNNRRRIQLLEESARLIYKEWFVKFRFPGHEKVRFKDGIPEGWEKRKLGEVSTILMGQSPLSKYYNENNEGLPFHQGVTNFGDRFPINKIYCNDPKARIAEKGDILFSVRAPVGRLNINLTKIIIGRGLASIKSKNNQQNFLYYLLKSYFFKENMIGGGAIFAAIKRTDLESVEFLYPTDICINEFEEVIKNIDSQILNLQLQNQKLKTARDILLPKLMKGEVVV